MDCSSCGKNISDGSKFCRFCGTEQEPGFCNNCGSAVGGKSSKKGGLVLLLVVILAFGLIFWRGGKLGNAKVELGKSQVVAGPSLIKQAQNLVLKPDKAEYEIIYATTIDFGENKTHEIYLLVPEGTAKRDQVDYAKKEIRARAEYNPKDVVYLYTCEDPDCREAGTFLGEFVSVNLALNPDYKLEEGFQPLTDSLYLKWNE